MTAPASLLIAIPLFDGITALDAIGPYEVLQRCQALASCRRDPADETVHAQIADPRATGTGRGTLST